MTKFLLWELASPEHPKLSTRNNWVILMELHYIFPHYGLFIIMEYKKHINIRIKEDQFLRLMKTVEEHETNLSELIRKMINRYEKEKITRQKNKMEG